jgi:hypothetical protein
MEKLTKKLEILNQEIIQRIIDLIETKGVKSKHTSNMVLSIQDEEQMHNLEGGRYLVELNSEVLIDNQGYQYHLESLEIKELCEVVDSIAEQPSKFRVGTMDSHGNGELYKYFEDEEKSYEHFIEQRSNESEVWMEKRLEDANRHGEYEYETVHTYCADEDTIENS